MRGLEDAPTWVLQRGQFMYPNVNGDLLSLQTSDCGLPSVAPSVVLVNVEKNVRREVADKPDSRGLPLGDLREVETSCRRLEHDL